MASILDILNTPAGEALINKASSKTSEEKDKVTSALGMALPLLLGAMKNNTKSNEGAVSLDKALSSDKHNGSLLDQLENLNSDDLHSEGGKIVNHILGDKEEKISSSLGSALNMDKNSLNAIIKMAAPVLLSLLGSQKRKDNVDQDGLGGLLGSVLGNSSKHDASFLETLLDRDGDGSVIDDIGGMILGGGKSNKSGGSILGGFTGGK
ncbi:DUF937 domain-containing protein [Christiangramia forsetii]|uniref:DUF937 domain-containing protein n=2 Tax=Christiangramia forsetii TaxID=411153 RepID=A0M1E6_CHRFK|nr:DUF937 domain-containing protein [Christiangramia forsetii]GGG42710.1 hypothetical protein GCM10011532_28220 [Christiangramia forsetii]CAL66441.1 conserved hypothetical protein [Christiangramia forsetii KT0803]